MAKKSFLDFEQPIAELESKIEELRYVQSESAVDISQEIEQLSKKSLQLDKVAEDLAHVVERVGALAVAGDLRHLPRRQVGVDVLGELQAFLAELLDLLRDIDRRFALHIAQLFDFAFELGEGLLEIEKNFFGQDRAPGSGSMNSQSANGAGLRRLRD